MTVPGVLVCLAAAWWATGVPAGLVPVNVVLLAAGIWLVRQGVAPDTGRGLAWRLRNTFGALGAACGAVGLLASGHLAQNVSGIGWWPDGVVWQLWGLAVLIAIVTVVWGAFQWGRPVSSPAGLTAESASASGSPADGGGFPRRLVWTEPVWVRAVLLAGWYLALLTAAFLFVYAYAWFETERSGGAGHQVFQVAALAAWAVSPAWAAWVWLPRRVLPRVVLAVAVTGTLAVAAFGFAASAGYDAGRDAWNGSHAADAAARDSQMNDLERQTRASLGVPVPPLPVPSGPPAAAGDGSLGDALVEALGNQSGGLAAAPGRETPRKEVHYRYTGEPGSVVLGEGEVLVLDGVPVGVSLWDGQCVLKVEGSRSAFTLMPGCGSGYIGMFTGDIQDWYDVADTAPRLLVSPAS